MRRFISVTVFSGLLTLFRMSSGFLIAKAVAVYTGPAGLALLGQVTSFITAINGVVTSPAGNGVIKYTAAHNAEGYDACAPWWRASAQWMLRLLIITMLISVLGANYISIWLFNDDSYFWLIVISGIVLPFSAANVLIASVINGLQDFRRYFSLGATSVFVATCVTISLVVKFRLEGALLSGVLFGAVCGCVMLLGVYRQPWFRLRYWTGPTESKCLAGIRSYMLMAITSAVCASASMIVTRNILITNVGLEQAGNWQAVYKISEVYLGLITLALATYFFPKLSALSTARAMRKEIFATAKIFVTLAGVMAVCVFLLRDIAITLLFTEEFRFARDLFAVQLVADVVKIFSWMLAYGMIARKATTAFISTEIFFSATFPVLVLIFVGHYGVDGANWAYLLNYVLYSLWLLYYSRTFLR